MKYLSLAALSHRPISLIGLGGRFGQLTDEVSFSLLDAYLDLGGNLLDTAHSYDGGEHERTIGRYLSDRNCRDRVIIVDKCCHPDDRGSSRVSVRSIGEDLTKSLERLQTDSIDIYMLHRDDISVPVGDIVDSLNLELDHGRIKSYGFSNWTHHRLEQAMTYASENRLIGPAASSCGFSLAILNHAPWPGCVIIDDSEKSWHERTGFPLLAWSSQARGWFSGRDFNTTSDSTFAAYDTVENRKRLDCTRVLALRRGFQPNEVALAYVLSQSFPVVALIGPESLSELSSSAAAVDLNLIPQELAFLEGDLGHAT